MSQKRGCHCLCQAVHPGRSVCTAWAETTVRIGDVEVAVCQSCAAEAKLRAIKDGKRQRDAYLQLNECPACGAYRLDGKPPLIHAEDCPYKDDTPLMYLPSDHES